MSESNSFVKNLNGQVAVVTGGSRGIGRAVCKKLASQGAKVIINYSQRADAADEIAKEIHKLGGNAQPMGFDVANEEAVEAAIKNIVAEHSKVDILVNNAGIAVDSLLVRTKSSDWDRTIAVNLSGCFYCAKAVAKSMMKARKGSIINLSSVIGEMGNGGQAAYSASKAGVLGLTKSLARELGSRGITVNAITPGYIQTDMTSGINDAQTKELLNQIPLNRLGEPEEVAELVAFLASPQATYITGQVIGINGGMYM